MSPACLAAACSIALVVMGIFARPASGQSEPDSPPRPIVIISDLHFGIGTTPAGVYDNLEDFRWPDALKGFLASVVAKYPGGADLVIAGDLLEMWQHPTVPCRGCGPDLGCKVDEYERIADIVARAHAADLKTLGAFANNGDNRLFVVPGNHDAALLHPPVWEIVKKRMAVTDSRRVELVRSGVWVSTDGSVVVEHGHQIAPDVNRYRNWPEVAKGVCEDDGVKTEGFVERPWGEVFVQELYNDVEAEYPIVDNLVPDSAGASVYRKARGVWGAAADLARFIGFNLFQTSIVQKITLDISDPARAETWNLTTARARGYRLFADALPADDPIRTRILTDESTEWRDVRRALNARAADEQLVSDAEVRALCDQIAARRAERPEEGIESCNPNLALSAARSILPLARVLQPHLETRINEFPRMLVFVYGHSHEADYKINVRTSRRTISVLNSGAFQRLLNLETFRQKAKARNLAPDVALKELTLEKDFPACYSAVLVDYDKNGLPRPVLHQWYMEEKTTSGVLLDGCDRNCGAIPPGCQRP